jgi:hypothetical protein
VAPGEWAGRGIVWQAVAVPRDPRQIQLEIDAARESLAATLDELAYRGSPKRLIAQGKDAAVRWLQSPPGMAVVGAVGLFVTVRVVQTVRKRNRPKGRKKR